MRRARLRLAAALAAATAIAVAAPALAPCPAAAANSDFNILVGAERGQVGLLAIGPYRARVGVFERVDGRLVPVRELTLAAPAGNRGGRALGFALLDSIAPWRCDRRTRSFVAFAAAPTGTVYGSEVSQVRTPSCARRFRLAAPRTARRGSRFRATVTDAWEAGGARPRLCLTAPGSERASCRRVRIAKGRTRASRRLRLRRKGHWRLELRTTHQRTRRTIAVGVKPRGPRPKSVLLLGDSMMAQLVAPIGERLGSRVETETLLEGGGRLTDPVFDWYAEARRKLRAVKPAAAVVLIGGGDGFPLRVDGTTVECCSAAWAGEYSKRVAAMMRTLRRGGRTRVVWVLYPAVNNAATAQVLAAVNRAIRHAAPRVRNVVLADLNPLISPGSVFREYAAVGGRRTKIRAADGIHFTLEGARIVAGLVVRTVGRLR